MLKVRRMLMHSRSSNLGAVEPLKDGVVHECLRAALLELASHGRLVFATADHERRCGETSQHNNHPGHHIVQVDK